MVFLHILDDFKYAVTFIKVLCSHGLSVVKCNLIVNGLLTGNRVYELK